VYTKILTPSEILRLFHLAAKQSRERKTTIAICACVNHSVNLYDSFRHWQIEHFRKSLSESSGNRVPPFSFQRMNSKQVWPFGPNKSANLVLLVSIWCLFLVGIVENKENLAA